MIAIRLFIAHRSDAEDINRLLQQLTTRTTKQYRFDEVCDIINQPDIFTWVVRGGIENRIVGMALVRVDNTRMFTMNYRRAFIGDVVVDKNHRGKGIGKELIEKCIETSHRAGAVHVNLTSNPNNPARAAAIKLYKKLGFKKIGKLNRSNYYRLKLKDL